MRKLIGFFLAAGLLVEPASLVLAQRSHAGGRSYSSGSRSSSFSGGRSYSSGSSSRSSSGGSLGSRSSSGSSSSRPSGGSGSPSRTSPFGGAPKSQPSSSRPSPNPTRPPRSSPGNSGRSYSSGTPSPIVPSRSSSGASGKSFSSSRPAPTVPSPSPPHPALGLTRPTGPPISFDRLAADAQRKEESRRNYTKGQQPRTAYTTPGQKNQKIDPRDRKIEALRRQLDHERWVGHERRQQEVFAPYTSRPVVVYNDPFSNLFWWWLLAQNLDTRARWAYYHREHMDDARYRELVHDNAQLEARIKELESKGTRRDPTWVPPGLEPDLMYTKEYVDAVYNPQPDPAASAAGSSVPSASSGAPEHVPPVSPGAARERSFGSFFFQGLVFLVKTLAVVGILAFLIWLVFFKRWGGTPARVFRPGGG